jgi:predicted transcriptional regulator
MTNDNLDHTGRYVFNITVTCDNMQAAIDLSRELTERFKKNPEIDVGSDKGVVDRESIKQRILDNIPTEEYIKIGNVYKICSNEGIVYRTFQRYVKALAVQGLILTKNIEGGRNGKTTLLKRLY